MCLWIEEEFEECGHVYTLNLEWCDDYMRTGHLCPKEIESISVTEATCWPCHLKQSEEPVPWEYMIKRPVNSLKMSLVCTNPRPIALKPEGKWR